jgi:hypothetical protein
MKEIHLDTDSMDHARTLRIDSLPAPFLNHLETRDAAVWVLELFVAEAGGTAVAELLRLPWRLVLTESSDPALLAELERAQRLVHTSSRRDTSAITAPGSSIAAKNAWYGAGLLEAAVEAN